MKLDINSNVGERIRHSKSSQNITVTRDACLSQLLIGKATQQNIKKIYDSYGSSKNCGSMSQTPNAAKQELSCSNPARNASEHLGVAYLLRDMRL